MADHGFTPAGIDFDRANAARMYDYFLGGAHNFAVDRDLGDQIEAQMPTIRRWAQGNRRFLGRLVRYCVDHGIRQFLDLGSGIPATGHVHEIARQTAPEARVAYVDFEPVAVAHSEEILDGVEGVSITRADVRHPSAVLSASSVTDVLDFDRPVAVIAVALLHFIPDDDLERMLAGYRDALVPGSYLGLAHSSADYDDPDLSAQITGAAVLYRDSATPAWLRDRSRIRELVGDLPLVDPGLVDINRWPDNAADIPEIGNYAMLARIP